jgi:hypothetical protein
MPTLSSANVRKKRIGIKQWALYPLRQRPEQHFTLRTRLAFATGHRWPAPAHPAVHKKLPWAIGYIRCGVALPVSAKEFASQLDSLGYFLALLLGFTF